MTPLCSHDNEFWLLRFYYCRATWSTSDHLRTRHLPSTVLDHPTHAGPPEYCFVPWQISCFSTHDHKQANSNCSLLGTFLFETSCDFTSKVYCKACSPVQNNSKSYWLEKLGIKSRIHSDAYCIYKSDLLFDSEALAMKQVVFIDLSLGWGMVSPSRNKGSRNVKNMVVAKLVDLITNSRIISATCNCAATINWPSIRVMPTKLVVQSNLFSTPTPRYVYRIHW